MIKHIFIDMDCTIADFCASPYFKTEKRNHNPPEMYEIGFFEGLPPMKGSLSGVRAVIELAKAHDIGVHILSKPVSATHWSYSEKVCWIAKWFPELSRNIIMCQHKELVSQPGHVLIDDYLDWKDKWEGPGGTFIHFEELKSSSDYWLEIVKKLESLIAQNK